MRDNPIVLIVEDGNEYLENLSRFVTGPRYLQAHDAAEALDLLAAESVDLVYLDMRFDRIERSRLVGDLDAITAESNGDVQRAWRFLQNNQGLFVLDAISRAGHTVVPVILAYDFSREPQRILNLQRRYPHLAWVADAVTPNEIRALMKRLIDA